MVVVKSLISTSQKHTCTLSLILNFDRLFVSDCFLLIFDTIFKAKSSYNIEKRV